MPDTFSHTENCTGCGLCARVCLARIIEMVDGRPAVGAERAAGCYHCRHCLAVCPAGAVSVDGMTIEDTRSLTPADPPDPDTVDTLILGRRSIRLYRDEDVNPELIRHLLNIAHHAPTARNARSVVFTLIDNRERARRLRDRVMSRLESLLDPAPPKGAELFALFSDRWKRNRVDVIFRDAPHLLVASAPRTAVQPLRDAVIALATFEIAARARGVGTLWNSFAHTALFELMPEFQTELGIPDDHIIGSTMSFGLPAVRYARTAPRGEADVRRVA